MISELTSPLVTIWVPVYNHKSYIRKCLDSLVSQQTSFNFEIILHDDASTDNSVQIIREYELKYPQILKGKYQSRNKLSKDGGYLIRTCYQMAQGRYVAICEGDDYWTDPYKLQKQVDFLELHDDFAICFHNTQVIDDEEGKLLFEQPGITENKIYSMPDFIKNNPIATASVMFRRKYIEFIPSWFNRSPFGDYTLYLYILNISKLRAGYLRDTMAVYRIHKNSLHGKVHLANSDYVLAYKQHLKFWKILKKHLFKTTYSDEINKTVASTYRLIIKNLLLNSKYIEAFCYNTIFLFRYHFSYTKENIRIYKQILRNLYK